MTAITFPTSPANGDTFLANGINYIWNSTKGTWSKQSTATPALVTGHILPDTTLTYDLGSATYKFRDLYMDGNTLHLGDETIKSGADGVEFTKLKVGHGGNTIKFEVDASTGRLKKESTKSGVKQPIVDDVESISDLSDVDITSSVPTDGQTLVWDNANSKFIPGDAGGGTALVGITSIDSVSTQSVLDALYDREYSLTSSASSINEGQTVTITLTTKYVPSDTVFGYVTTGITSADLDSGSAGLTGNFVMSDTGVDWQKSGTVSYILKNDITLEGAETIQFDVSNIPSPNTQSLQVTVNDTSKPSITSVSYEPNWIYTVSTSTVGCQVIASTGKAGDGTYSWWNTTHNLGGDDIIWIYLIGGGGAGNGLIYSGQDTNTWRFGGAGGRAMLIVTTVYDAFNTNGGFNIGAGGTTNAAGNTWRGSNGTTTTFTAANGTIFNCYNSYGLSIHNPRNQMKQDIAFNGTNWNWPLNVNGLSTPTRTNFAVGSDAQVWGTTAGLDTAPGVTSYPQNVTWGGGRGEGSGTSNWTTNKYQGTSRYAGDGGTIGYDNAGTPGGGGSMSQTLAVESGAAHKPGKRGEARIYWKI